MNKFLLELPTRIEAGRLYLRWYQPGDGPLYFAVSQRNRAHLAEYEAQNVLMEITTEESAEIVVRELAAGWVARTSFFLGAFDRQTDEWVAQVYIGPSNWELPEFELGYVVDQAYEGQGYATEAVKAALQFVFEHLQAHRVHLRCDATNVRSARLAERCGFRLEGRFRENKAVAAGEYHDTLHYGLLRGEFKW
jgi:[ribosomal protein S5]-alanine N-acetyltransferase